MSRFVMLLHKHDADAAFSTPDHVAGLPRLPGHDVQGDLVRNADVVTTSSAAPVNETLRIVQSKLTPSNSIDPALKTRCLAVARLSSIAPFKLKV